MTTDRPNYFQPGGAIYPETKWVCPECGVASFVDEEFRTKHTIECTHPNELRHGTPSSCAEGLWDHMRER